MTVAVVVLTYASGIDSPRHEYAKLTVEGLVKNLQYSGHIHYHIADDGSPLEHVMNLPVPEDFSMTNAGRKGYGASYNLATQALHWSYEYLLMVEDDWQLVRPLNLDPLVAALQDGLSCIRLGYIGWTQELRGTIAKYADQTFLELAPDSAEPHVWSGHPRLETREFQRQIGEWPEDVDPGTTEFIVAKRQESRYGVAWPLDMAVNASQQWANTFAHIGATQARDDQKSPEDQHAVV